jgi:AhpC/TSA antioxidant enzyme
VKVLGKKERLQAAGAAALFVVHDEPARIRETMLHNLDVPFPVLVDHDRIAYRAWGLRRARWWTVWLDPHVWRSYARMLRQGERFTLGRDTLQLGGDFVVAPSGEVVYSRPQKTDDRPPVGVLLKAVEQAAREHYQ